MNAPYMGKLCPFIIPCSLMALDHWSPEVKVCFVVDDGSFLVSSYCCFLNSWFVLIDAVFDFRMMSILGIRNI